MTITRLFCEITIDPHNGSHTWTWPICGRPALGLCGGWAMCREHVGSALLLDEDE